MTPIITTTPYRVSPADWSNRTQVQLLVASDPGSEDHFGGSNQNNQNDLIMNRDGDYLFVGASQYDGVTTSEGKVYIFEKTDSPQGWTEIATLSPTVTGSPIDASGHFGSSLSVSDDGVHLLIGALSAEAGGTGSGAVYYFEKTGPTTWTYRQKFSTSTSSTGDNFGCSVSTDSTGTYCVVGAYVEDTFGSNAGSVAFFKRSGTTWTETQKIGPPVGGGSFDWFGGNLAMSPDGTHCLVGAVFNNTGHVQWGSVFSFIREGSPETWTYKQQLQGSETSGSPNITVYRFGQSISISSDGNTAIIGAESTVLVTTGGEGTAFVYTRSGSPSTWTEVQRLDPSDPDTVNTYGRFVDISPDASMVVIGAHADNTGGALNGAAYVWTGTPGSYTEQVKLQSDVADAGQFFGKVCISNGTEVFVGAPEHAVTVAEQGVIYVYEAG